MLMMKKLNSIENYQTNKRLNIYPKNKNNNCNDTKTQFDFLPFIILYRLKWFTEK